MQDHEFDRGSQIDTLHLTPGLVENLTVLGNTIEGIREGRDEVLEAAVELVTSGEAAAGATL